MNVVINDIVDKDSKLVFICESPHIDEVQKNFPLAGYSGKQMTQYLLGNSYEDIPLGLIAKERVFLTTKFSVINVSRQPMQESAYSKNRIQPPKNIKLYEAARNLRSISNHKIPSHLKKLVDDIYIDFRSRCVVFSNTVLFIPCGKFAQGFFKRFNAECGYELNYIDGIPHPSRNQWAGLTQDQLSRITLRANK